MKKICCVLSFFVACILAASVSFAGLADNVRTIVSLMESRSAKSVEVVNMGSEAEPAYAIINNIRPDAVSSGSALPEIGAIDSQNFSGNGYHWATLGWSACSAGCGVAGAVETRGTACRDRMGNDVDASLCVADRPADETRGCETVCGTCRELHANGVSGSGFEEHVIDFGEGPVNVWCKGDYTVVYDAAQHAVAGSTDLFENVIADDGNLHAIAGTGLVNGTNFHVSQGLIDRSSTISATIVRQSLSSAISGNAKIFSGPYWAGFVDNWGPNNLLHKYSNEWTTCSPSYQDTCCRGGELANRTVNFTGETFTGQAVRINVVSNNYDRFSWLGVK